MGGLTDLPTHQLGFSLPHAAAWITLISCTHNYLCIPTVQISQLPFVLWPPHPCVSGLFTLWPFIDAFPWTLHPRVLWSLHPYDPLQPLFPWSFWSYIFLALLHSYSLESWFHHQAQLKGTFAGASRSELGALTRAWDPFVLQLAQPSITHCLSAQVPPSLP